MDGIVGTGISDVNKRACCSSDLSLQKHMRRKRKACADAISAAFKAPLMQHMQIVTRGSDDVIVCLPPPSVFEVVCFKVKPASLHIPHW